MPKKCIIVVGKRNHGKSSFCKMLAHPDEKQSIKASAGLKSVTQKCSLIRIDPKLKLNQQDLFLIDTPGLDSQSGIFSTLDQLEQFILEKQCQIVALIYVLDIHQSRELDENGEGSIFKFFNMMKLRRSIKNSIMICVLSKFDKNYDSYNSNKKLINQYSAIFKDRFLQSVWQRQIKWMSQSIDCEKYKKIIQDSQHEAHNIWQMQWKLLKGYLDQIINEKYFLSFNQYSQDLKLFQQKVGKGITTILQSQQESCLQQVRRDIIIQQFEEESIATGLTAYFTGAVGFAGFTSLLEDASIVVNPAIQPSSTLKVVGQTWSIAGTTIAKTAQCIKEGIKGQIKGGITEQIKEGMKEQIKEGMKEKVTKNLAEEVTVRNALSLTGMVLAGGLMIYGIHKLFKTNYYLKGKYFENDIQRQIQEQHSFRLQYKIKQIQLQQLQNCTKVTSKSLRIHQSLWFDDIKADLLNKNNQRKSLNFVRKGLTRQAQIEPGRLTLIYRARIPTIKAYDNFLQKETIGFYGKI